MHSERLLIVEVGTYQILRESINHLYDKGIYCQGLAYPVARSRSMHWMRYRVCKQELVGPDGVEPL